MIKKILLFILVLILIWGLISSFAHGVSLFGGKIETSSYTDIAKLSQELVSKKRTLEKVNDTDYPQALVRQQASQSSFRINKSAYQELELNASPADIRKANQKEEYLLDYLWMKIGTYANDSDIKVLITPKPEESRIYFDVSGQYIAVINFIYDLENDDDLGFNVDNIVMQGGSSDAVTKASFYVGNVNVVNSSLEND